MQPTWRDAVHSAAQKGSRNIRPLGGISHRRTCQARRWRPRLRGEFSATYRMQGQPSLLGCGAGEPFSSVVALLERRSETDPFLLVIDGRGTDGRFTSPEE